MCRKIILMSPCSISNNQGSTGEGHGGAEQLARSWLCRKPQLPGTLRQAEWQNLTSGPCWVENEIQNIYPCFLLQSMLLTASEPIQSFQPELEKESRSQRQRGPPDWPGRVAGQRARQKRAKGHWDFSSQTPEKAIATPHSGKPLSQLHEDAFATSTGRMIHHTGTGSAESSMRNV